MDTLDISKNERRDVALLRLYKGFSQRIINFWRCLLDTLCFPNWIIESAKLGSTDAPQMLCGNRSSKCNISTFITKYNRAILQQHIGSNENNSLEVTGKVW